MNIVHVLLLWNYFSFNLCPSLDCWLHNQFYRLLYSNTGLFKSLWLMLRLLSLTYLFTCLYLPAVHHKLLQKTENRKEYKPSCRSKWDSTWVITGIIRWQSEVWFLDYSDVITLSLWVVYETADWEPLLICEISGCQ